MPITPRLVVIAGGGVVGATLRWGIGEVLETGGFPWATFLVNVVGSTLLAWVSASALEPTVGAALGTGFCGGLTTFSTFSIEVVEMIDDGRVGIAVIYGASSVAVALAAFVGVRLVMEPTR